MPHQYTRYKFNKMKWGGGGGGEGGEIKIFTHPVKATKTNIETNHSIIFQTLLNSYKVWKVGNYWMYIFTTVVSTSMKWDVKVHISIYLTWHKSNCR